MHLSVLELGGGLSRRNREQSIEVSGFRDNSLFTLGYINLDLISGLMQVAFSFISLLLQPLIVYRNEEIRRGRT